jgi:NAD(P)-dependent dehydrogenase (short-subunit alcohol dehydrogenase family)
MEGVKMKLLNKVALVTGAGTGIGKACSLTLLENGYQVVLVGRRMELLESVISESAAPKTQSLACQADISDVNQVDKLFEQVKNHFGRLDVLFNNAGRGTPMMPFDEIPFDMWQKTVGVNLTGTFLCAQRAFKMMREQSPQGGRIINNGSISAHAPRPFSAPYTSTKHAITGLTKSIALDGRPFHIACSQIDIGNAATEMSEPMAKGILQANGQILPEDRMPVQEVANAVLHMSNLPLDSNILFMTIMATNMPLIGRG